MLKCWDWLNDLRLRYLNVGTIDRDLFWNFNLTVVSTLLFELVLIAPVSGVYTRGGGSDKDKAAPQGALLIVPFCAYTNC